MTETFKDRKNLKPLLQKISLQGTSKQQMETSKANQFVWFKQHC